MATTQHDIWILPDSVREEERKPKMKNAVFYKLITVTPYHFIHVPFISHQSPNPAHTQAWTPEDGHHWGPFYRVRAMQISVSASN